MNVAMANYIHVASSEAELGHFKEGKLLTGAESYSTDFSLGLFSFISQMGFSSTAKPCFDI